MRNEEKVVHGILLICFLVSGFIHGFHFPGVVGILGVLAFHYRGDLNRAAPAASVTETDAWKYEELKEKISQLNALVALKTGLRPRQPEGSGLGQK